jgi:hypothetical protein
MAMKVKRQPVKTSPLPAALSALSPTALVFTLTIFTSATLLFLVQPMIAKMILPKFGGTPAVWNTCMVFFQAMLLAGYSYAHAATGWFGPRRMAPFHVGFLAVPILFVLPFAVSPDWAPPPGANPIPWLLYLLLVTVGLPFFLVSTSAPLLQKWFASTGDPGARDPYFLYAASNLGSMLALIGYPALIEPGLYLRGQAWAWFAGYVVLVGLTAACAWMVWKSPGEATAPEASLAPEANEETPDRLAPPPTWLGRAHWVALAFVPSSLMLGVTTYMSTDLAAIPLIWVIPLALYLLSFILVFSRLPETVHQVMILSIPVLVLLQAFLMYSGSSQKLWVLFCLHLATLFAMAMVCHGELARRRPDTRHLTEYYLWMSFGGVLGGMFNALLAPQVFLNWTEYPIALVIGCLLVPPLEAEEASTDPVEQSAFLYFLRRLGSIPGRIAGWLAPIYRLPAVIFDILLPIALGLATWGLLKGLSGEDGWSIVLKMRDAIEYGMELLGMEQVITAARLRQGLQYGVPALLCYFLVARPVRFGLGFGLMLAAFGMHALELEGSPEAEHRVILRERSFFGIMKVERTQYQGQDFADYGGNYHRLVHGTTLHGKQPIDSEGRPVHDAEPLTYYHRTGPIGQVITSFDEKRRVMPFALIGLGTGSLAAYGEKGQAMDYYEIDPAVVEIADDERYFTYLTDARQRGVEIDIILGDARLSMREAPDARYTLIVVDAFSSDAIPIHLITREALELYRSKLAPGGIVAFHISNRYLDLEPVVANLARDLGMTALVRGDASDERVGKSGSTWCILAEDPSDFGQLLDDVKKDEDDSTRQWTRMEDQRRWMGKRWSPHVGVWTDDFSNIVSVFIWKN